MFIDYYFVNNWFYRAGKPPSGLHLDVMKDGKMFQVLKKEKKEKSNFTKEVV